MIVTNIKNLKYSKADNSTIDLFATCEEYGEIPMTLNIVDTEDLHEYFDGKFFDSVHYIFGINLVLFICMQILT